jgi:RimJ/RimL family protein N-acetyltransferase
MLLLSDSVLTIRPMRLDDLPALQALLSDARVMRYLEPPYSPQETEAFLRTSGLAEPPLIYAVEDQDTCFLGYLIYHRYDDELMELGWVLKFSAWGKGYASRLTQMIIEKARLEGKKLIIEASPEQEATRRIALKHGFLPAGSRDGLDLYLLT